MDKFNINTCMLCHVGLVVGHWKNPLYVGFMEKLDQSEEGLKIYLSQPNPYPLELVNAFSSIAEMYPQIKTAYLAQIVFVEEGEESRLLIAVDSDEDASNALMASLLSELSSLSSQDLADQPVELYRYHGNESFKKYFEEAEIFPFYSSFLKDKCILGPLSEIELNLLKEPLDLHQIEYNVFHRERDLTSDLNYKASVARFYEFYSGPARFLYLTIKKDRILVVKAVLDKLGYSPTKHEPLEQCQEYVCPKCRFVSNLEGECPTHGISFLDFDSNEFAQEEFKYKQKRRLVRYYCLVVLPLVGLVALMFFG